MKPPRSSQPKSVRLTKAERDALLAVERGADVTGYDIAQTLRAIERKAPHFITITRVRGNYGDGVGPQPYFGAIATAAGLAAASHGRVRS